MIINLKERPEELKIKRDKVRIPSVDDANMYLFIKLASNIKVVRLFSRKLTATTKNAINLCLEIIRFGMSSNLISFYREYCEYYGGEKEQKGFAVGGYESSFLSYLVVYYHFDKINTLLN